MTLSEFRNMMREWVRTNCAIVLPTLELVVPNESNEPGLDDNYLRYSLNTGEADIVGVGTAVKRSRRFSRLNIEIFGKVGAGEGDVSEQATLIEDFIRDATVGSGSPDPLITIYEPSTFERPEVGRYCQVVTARVESDHVS